MPRKKSIKILAEDELTHGPNKSQSGSGRCSRRLTDRGGGQASSTRANLGAGSGLRSGAPAPSLTPNRRSLPSQFYGPDAALARKDHRVLNENHGFVTLKYCTPSRKTETQRQVNARGGRSNTAKEGHAELGYQLSEQSGERPIATDTTLQVKQNENQRFGYSFVGCSTLIRNHQSAAGGVDVPANTSFTGANFRTSYGSASDSGIDVSTPVAATLPATNMVPVSGVDVVSDSLKDAIQDLFDIETMIHGYQYETQVPLIEKMVDLTASLSRVRALTDPSHSQSVAHTLSSVPPELVDYVDEGRNPDIYTREIVELVQRGNAVVNGKMDAFRGLSERLAEKLRGWDVGGASGTNQELGGSIDMDEEVGKIMRNAGLEGEGDGKVKSEGQRNGSGDNAVKREGA